MVLMALLACGTAVGQGGYRSQKESSHTYFDVSDSISPGPARPARPMRNTPFNPQADFQFEPFLSQQPSTSTPKPGDIIFSSSVNAGQSAVKDQIVTRPPTVNGNAADRSLEFLNDQNGQESDSPFVLDSPDGTSPPGDDEVTRDNAGNGDNASDADDTDDDDDTDDELIEGFQLRAGKTQFKVGGYVKLDSIFDFQEAGEPDFFDPNTFPIQDVRGPHSRWHARQSRLNLDVRNETDWGQARIYLEGDFFGNGNAFRLRHAYGEFGRWLVGQTFTVIDDPDGFIDTLDFNGPSGNATFRTAQLRWTSDVHRDWQWMVSLEEPSHSSVNPLDGDIYNRMPLLVSAIRRDFRYSHLYVSGSVGEARFFSTDGIESRPSTWGAVATFVRTVGPHRVVLKYGAARGFDLLSISNNTGGINGVFDGQLMTLFRQGYVAGYQRVFNDYLRSTISFRSLTIDNAASQDGDALHGNLYASSNLVWSPFGNKNIDVGVEYLWGQRENKDGQDNDAHRLQMSVIYRIP